MIWSEGKILPDDGLSISVLDRTFEHGLGLFETLRTWGGRPTLLDEHKARVLRSAEELKLTIDPASLPDAEAVRTLLEAEGIKEDRMLRITASGGTASGKSVVWMRSSPLPPPTREGGAVACVKAWRCIALDDLTTRHKTLNYWFRRIAYEEAREQGYDESLILCIGSGYSEGTRSNLFIVCGQELITPSLKAPIVPGIMRQLVLEVSEELPLIVTQVERLDPGYLKEAGEIFLTNAVRGIVPVRKVDLFKARIERQTIERQAPGPWTQKLQDLIAERLWPDRGGSP